MVILTILYPIYRQGYRSDFHWFYSSLPELLNEEKKAGGNPIDYSLDKRPRSWDSWPRKIQVAARTGLKQSSSALTVRARAGCFT